MRPFPSFWILLLVLIAGCGGSGNRPIGQVSGFVQDVNGNTVRDARVWVEGGPQTFANSNGAYLLDGVRGANQLLKARVFQDGLEYYGEQVVSIFDGERSKSANITVVRANQRATLRGTVYDRNGFLVQGARVFAVSGELTSTIAVTNSSGRFEIRTLLGGATYTVVASALGYNSDTETVNISAGQSRDLDFTLGNPSNVLLSPPQNLDAVAWTSPSEISESAQQRAGIAAVQQMIDPRLKRRVTRDTANGNWIEVDLSWDVYNHPALLGFAIYRIFGDAEPVTAIDFYRDPQAILYADADAQFHENETYSYRITALNTSYDPQDPTTESDPSNRVVVTTLGDLQLQAPLAGPRTFRWLAGSGATSYTVYVFDRFPAIGVTSLWSGTTGNTQLAYGGPALQAGQTYYYLVVGSANNGKSRTVSVIDSFVAH